MPQIHAIALYQRQYPPVHQIAAAAVGYKGKARSKPKGTNDGFTELLSQFASVGVNVTRRKKKNAGK